MVDDSESFAARLTGTKAELSRPLTVAILAFGSGLLTVQFSWAEEVLQSQILLKTRIDGL
jgi:hypothetical protein